MPLRRHHSSTCVSRPEVRVDSTTRAIRTPQNSVSHTRSSHGVAASDVPCSPLAARGGPANVQKLKTLRLTGRATLRCNGEGAPDLKLRHDIVRMIRKHKPELVITHIPGRVLDAPMGGSHPDHLAVGEATMAAVYPDSRNPRAFRSLLKEGLQPHEVKEVWIPFWTSGDHLVDISSTLDQKIAALRKHKSQVAKPGREWDFEKFMRKRHREVGRRGGYRYAESFKRITV